MFQASLGKKQDLISKITRAKRAGGMVQDLEHFPRKHEVLSPNPSTEKKKKLTTTDLLSIKIPLKGTSGRKKIITKGKL
jgi:hypothetical protein